MANLHIHGLEKDDAMRIYRRLCEIFGTHSIYGKEIVVTIHKTTVLDLQGNHQPYILIWKLWENRLWTYFLLG